MSRGGNVSYAGAMNASLVVWELPPRGHGLARGPMGQVLSADLDVPVAGLRWQPVVLRLPLAGEMRPPQVRGVCVPVSVSVSVFCTGSMFCRGPVLLCLRVPVTCAGEWVGGCVH